MLDAHRPEPGYDNFIEEPGMPVSLWLRALRQRLRLITIGPVVVGALAFGASYFVPPIFTATTTFMPPQQAQSSAASALAGLGALGALSGIPGVGGMRSPAEQYVALMQSVTVSDRIGERFKLQEVYDVDYKVEVRDKLAQRVRINAGKKDGLITIEVDDRSPERAAAMANQYVTELRQIVGTLAVSEAQQRRLFFDQQLKQTRDKLVAAQQALQRSGFNPGALKAEPKAAAEAFAKLKAEATAAEVKLQTLRGSLADNAPEVRQQQATLGALRDQLARAAQATTGSDSDPDYIGRYREFKYQETLFELYARQFELARVDESREGGLIQVVDAATPPEKKSKPRRGVISVMAALVSAVLLVGVVLLRARRDVPPARPTPA